MNINKLNFADLDAEKELIAIICNYPDFIKSIQQIVSADIFYYDIIKASYLACIELYSEKGKITLPDLILRLKSNNTNDWVTILDMQSTKNPLDGKELIYYLAELKGKREALELSNSITKGLANGESYHELLDKINKVSSDTILKDSSSEVIDMVTALKNSMEELGDIMTNGIPSGVPTGYTKLDDITGGWLKGNVILFAGRPGQGKSIALLEHAKHASKNGFNALFLSLEMPVNSLINRMISGSLADGTPYSKIKSGSISIETYQKIDREAITELSKLPITWYDNANRDVNYLSNMIRRLVKEKNIKIVAIDYLQLMTDSKIKSDNETQVVGSVSKKIQQLAKELNIPIMCAVQLNRSTEGRTSHRPRLGDLRSSGQIEQDASVVVGLYREDYYAYEKAKEEGYEMPEFNNIIEYIFLKNRDGDTRTLDLYIDVKTSTIKEFEEKSRF
jgi:replicative DNA helicase